MNYLHASTNSQQPKKGRIGFSVGVRPAVDEPTTEQPGRQHSHDPVKPVMTRNGLMTLRMHLAHDLSLLVSGSMQRPLAWNVPS